MSDENNLQTKSKINTKLLIGAAAVIVAVLIAVLVIFVPKAANARKLEEQLSLGDKYLSELQYEQAVVAYLAAIEIDPKNVDAYLGLADAYVAQGEYDEAIEVLEDALDELEGEGAEEVKEKLEEVENLKKQGEAGITVVPDVDSTPVPTNAPVVTVTSTPIPLPTENPRATQNVEQLSMAEIGSKVYLGTYEQDDNLENGAENVEWLVVDRQGKRVLLLSSYALEVKDYYENDLTWEKSTLRTWMNDEFYNNAFSEECKTYIQKSGDTKDFVRLLTGEELLTLFDTDAERICSPTAYAIALDWDEDSAYNWWLCIDEENDAFYDYGWGPAYKAYGDEWYGSGRQTVTRCGIRPVINVSTELFSNGEAPSKGDVLTFGAYEQDNNARNGKEDIEWIVLEVVSDGITLISKYVLDNKEYDATEVMWENSTIREWLNEDFYFTSFESIEQECIMETPLSLSEDPYTHQEEKDTVDKVFLLSMQEVDYYFPSEAERCVYPSKYAAKRAKETMHEEVKETDTVMWWTRTTGSCIDEEGWSLGSGILSSKYASARYVRPAIWVSVGENGEEGTVELPEVTNTPMPTATPTPTSTPAPTNTPTPTPTNTPTPTPKIDYYATLFDYEFNADGGITILGSKRRWNEEELILPAEISGYPVTRIGEAAFRFNSNVKHVEISEGIQIIEDDAFYQCTSLESINFPSTLKEIGIDAFYNCGNLLSIILPENIEYVGIRAFSKCDALEEIIFPNSNICKITFEELHGIKKVTIPKEMEKGVEFINCDGLEEVTIESYHSGIFKRCDNLKTIKLGNMVKEIDGGAFSYCTSLEEVVISEGVTEIGFGSFMGCTNLKKVVIPESVEDIGEDVFWKCSNVSLDVVAGSYGDIYARENNLTAVTSEEKENGVFSFLQTNEKIIITGLVDRSIKDLVIPAEINGLPVTEIATRAFEGCNSLKSVTVSSGLVKIGYDAFWGCDNLESVELPDTVLEVGNGAFTHCWALNHVVLSNAMKKINDYVFYNCNNLRQIDIPDNIQVIGEHAFWCTGLEELILSENVTEIGVSAFAGCGALEKINIFGSCTLNEKAFQGCSSLKEVELSNQVKYVGEYLFAECESLETIIIPEGVECIEKYMFFGCTNLKSVEIPSSVKIVKARAFMECSSLENLCLPDSVVEIGERAYEACLSLKNVNLPNGVQVIRGQVFAECAAMEKIAFPEGMKAIGDYAFCDCTSIKTIVIPESVCYIGKFIFNDTCGTIYTPSGSYAEQYAIQNNIPVETY